MKCTNSSRKSRDLIWKVTALFSPVEEDNFLTPNSRKIFLCSLYAPAISPVPFPVTSKVMQAWR